MAEMLIKSGANVDIAENQYGYTPLMSTAMMSTKRFYNLIWKWGNEFNDLVLLWTLENYKIAELLVNNNADLKLLNKNGDSAESLAAALGI